MTTKTKRLVQKTAKLLPAGLAATVPAQAAPPAAPKAPTNAPQQAVKAIKFVDTNVARVAALRANPVLPRVGQLVTVTVFIINDSDKALSKVPYVLSGAVTKQGVISNLAAHSKHAITATFTAQSSKYELKAVVDPANVFKEPVFARRNNEVKLDGAVLPAATSPWGQYAAKAMEAGFADVKGGMFKSYRLGTSVQGTIMATALHISGLKITQANSSTANPAVTKKVLTDAGVPDDIAEAINQTFVTCYKNWASNYRAVIPGAYPAFAAFPGPKAPPMPAIPFPLLAGGGPSAEMEISPATIENRLRGNLSSERKNAEGADAAITAMAIAMSASFHTFMAMQQATNVMGSGPVPSFAPPYVPVGPVVSGTVGGATTHLDT
ncbi:MAG: CARDB domain-containing protein [Polyangiaceae bacterium]